MLNKVLVERVLLSSLGQETRIQTEKKPPKNKSSPHQTCPLFHLSTSGNKEILWKFSLHGGLAPLLTKVFLPDSEAQVSPSGALAQRFCFAFGSALHPFFMTAGQPTAMQIPACLPPFPEHLLAPAKHPELLQPPAQTIGPTSIQVHPRPHGGHTATLKISKKSS